VRLAQLLIGLPDLGTLDEFEAGAKGVQRRTPILALDQRLGDVAQRCGLLLLATRKLIGSNSGAQRLERQVIDILAVEGNGD
jgi:hypothetical protein